MLNLDQHNLLASGGQADIYQMEDGRVLRLLRKPEDEYLVQYEIAALKAVKSYGITAPEVFEAVKVEERPGLIMERIKGQSMQAHIQQKPLTLRQKARELAALHLRLGSVKAPPGIVDTKVKARVCIAKSTLLPQEQKDFAVRLLDELPDGDSLCHGDFHPGNILVNEAGNHIIDWCGASRGEISSDIAHTYLLLKNTPRLPHISGFAYHMMKTACNVMARAYLKKCDRIQPMDWSNFSKWTVVQAAERTFFGLPSEKARLLEYINECYQRRLSGRPEKDWYKSL